MSIDNLERMLCLADDIDIREGKLAYERYNAVMKGIANEYGFGLPETVAVFVSLSPNSDYFGNLRSTVSVLSGIRDGLSRDAITVSTYKHCRDRAILYATGERIFLKETKGPKITNFYHNVLNPDDTRFVTIDGHMSAIWQGKNLTMRDALISLRQYREIAAEVKRLAFANCLLPNQLQAILWFARKRISNVKYDPQGSFFTSEDDRWNTSINVKDIKPYESKGDSVKRDKRKITTFRVHVTMQSGAMRRMDIDATSPDAARNIETNKLIEAGFTGFVITKVKAIRDDERAASEAAGAV